MRNVETDISTHLLFGGGVDCSAAAFDSMVSVYDARCPGRTGRSSRSRREPQGGHRRSVVRILRGVVIVPAAGYPSLPPPRIEPIVRPGAPVLARMDPAEVSVPSALLSAGIVAPGLVGCALLASDAWRGFGVALIAAVVGLLAGVLVAIARARRDNVVSAPDYSLRGVPIQGAALDLLADVQQRFRWARKMFAEVPTGIRWTEVEGQVDVLLWEAAEHAAKVSALDVELEPFGYAETGTPQAALRRQLEARREALWQRIVDTQREADQLAREASNAAAAARIALARTGSVYELELVTPSVADLVARGTLAAARARLAMLAEVWGELDETGELADERFRKELGS
jgi:hypothetical protein